MSDEPRDLPTERLPLLCSATPTQGPAGTVRNRHAALVVTGEHEEMRQLRRALDRQGIEAVEAPGEEVALTRFLERQADIALVFLATGQGRLNATRLLAGLWAIDPQLRCIFIGSPQLVGRRGAQAVRRPLNTAAIEAVLRETLPEFCRPVST